MYQYMLSDYQLPGINPFQLDPAVLQQIIEINHMIEPIILENHTNNNNNNHHHHHHRNQSSSTGTHSPDNQRKPPLHQHRSKTDNRSFSRNNNNNNNNNQFHSNASSNNNIQNSTPYATRSPNNHSNQLYNTRRTMTSPSSSMNNTPSNTHEQDASWERMQEFKTTKITKSIEGPDKIIQDIRTCLNKLSSKNYDSQKILIMQHLQEIQDIEQMPKIAQSIFDIASSNRFYSELYSQLYKELVDVNIFFSELLQPFLQNYMTNIKEIQSFSADDDYDGFCAYNKQNELRKATTVFIVHLMKQGVIPRLRVLSLIISLQDYIVQRVEVDDYTNEIEEMTENLFLFIKESLGQFNDVKTEWMWKYRCIPMIETFSKYKKNDKPSISSRAIFKYMDMMTEIKKAESPKN